MVTINDVARRAGVAPIAVSRVVNSTSYAHPETPAVPARPAVGRPPAGGDQGS